MYCPIMLGSDKTTVSVATGNIEYHPLYLTVGFVHNSVRRAHRNAVVPIGFLAGVYLSEYSGKAFAFAIRYTVDLLNGVPSIVIGIVAYALVVRPMKGYSTFAGGNRLGQRCNNVEVHGFGGCPRFLGLLQNRDSAHVEWQLCQQRRGVERTEQPDLQHTDFLAARPAAKSTQSSRPKRRSRTNARC